MNRYSDDKKTSPLITIICILCVIIIILFSVAFYIDTDGFSAAFKFNNSFISSIKNVIRFVFVTWKKLLGVN